MDALTDSQAAALEQLQTITNGADIDVSISVLESVNWDVQQATDVIFGGQPEPSTSERAPMLENRDESIEMQSAEEWGQAPHQDRSVGTSSSLPGRGTSLFSLLAYPLHFLSSVLRFVFSILRIPIPTVLLRFSSLNYYRTFSGFTSSSNRPTDPRTAAERWVRALEEETGALCISQQRAQTQAFGSASGAEAGPSNLSHRGSEALSNGDGGLVLPDFVLSSYENVLKTCQREARVGCIILVSEEHDDAPAFKRNTLTDPTFVKLLTDNNVVVWGADVRDRDGWSASQKLQATTYPFVAFVALQPRRGASSSSATSSPSLTVLSRHQGSPSPASGPDAGPTSPAVLSEHLERQVIPRVNSFLDRVKAGARERERERQLRLDQDRAFEESARRDKERIERRMAEEKREREERERREVEERAEAERVVREAEERERQAEIRMAWRRYARHALVLPESSSGTDSVRIAIRLPDGRRLVRAFAARDSLTALFAFIDAQFIPDHFSSSEDPASPPSSIAEGEAGIVAQIATSPSPCDSAVWWGFRVATSYPRKEISWAPNTSVGSVEGVKGGGQLIVEPIVTSQRTSMDSRKDTLVDDDGYESED